MRSDDDYMQMALQEAELAIATRDVPVGAIVIDALGNVVGRGRNRREADRDPTAHAEVIALRAASATLETWRLADATLYVTLEPCPMCAGAMVNARIGRVVYGCDDPKAGALRSLFDIGTNRRLNHTFAITGGIRATECAQYLRSFFSALRANA
jgi:tRNA(adenine34) deaminase